MMTVGRDVYNTLSMRLRPPCNTKYLTSRDLVCIRQIEIESRYALGRIAHLEPSGSGPPLCPFGHVQFVTNRVTSAQQHGGFCLRQKQSYREQHGFLRRVWSQAGYGLRVVFLNVMTRSLRTHMSHYKQGPRAYHSATAVAVRLWVCVARC